MAQAFLKLIGALFGTACRLNPQGSYPQNYAPRLQETEIFDFIVVGGGTAGCVVAGRLSENPNWKVLLVEAGGYPTSLTEVLSLSPVLQNSDLDWKYELPRTEDTCLAYKENRCGLTRGKVLGGCGSINGAVYVRSPEGDYDNWSDKGNVGWDWKNVSNYFKKAENFPGHDGYGSQGPITLHKFESKNKLSSILVDSYSQLGNDLHTNEADEGLFELIYNIENGTRCSTPKAYIAKNKNRANLYIALKAKVTKIIFLNNDAVGVDISTSGRTVNVGAFKEIILSAGSIGSPQLLMLSGIGPKEHLKSLDITVIKNLSVGKNFHDHPVLFIPTKIEPEAQNINYLKEQIAYCKDRTGAFTGETNIHLMFSAPGGIHMQFIHLPKFTQKLILQQAVSAIMGFDKATTRSIADYASKSDLLIYSLYLGNPNFRGEILLRSKNPNDQPLIYPRLLSNETDIKQFKVGIGLIKQLILNATAMIIHNASLIELYLKNCNTIPFDTDEYWDCYIRNVANLYFHSVGSCKMGVSSDPEAVVDPRLRVHGINKLRVVDGSIMPEVVNRNTHATIIMIGEKGADMIKEDNPGGK